MGSKSRIAKYIVPIIQGYIDKTGTDTYIEPFVGGANIIDKIRCKRKYGYDKNRFLIALLSAVSANSNGDFLYNEVPKELYDTARNEYNSGEITSFTDWQIGNIGFLASYNGRFFDGGYAKPGYEKTKKGLRYRDYYRESKDNLLTQAPFLKDITFDDADYKDLDVEAINGTVIYADPPYENTKKFANAASFNYNEFWAKMDKFSENNIVLVSELSAPDNWECIWEKSVNRSIKATDKSVATEKLFIHRRNI